MVSEEFFEVTVHNVGASIQVLHLLSPPRFIDPFQDRSSGLRWWTFQTRWRFSLCRFFARKSRLFPSHLLSCSVQCDGESLPFHSVLLPSTNPLHSRMCGICSCSVGSIQGKTTTPVHWLRRACAHCVFSLWTRYLCLEDVFLPVDHRLNSLPPSM